MVNTTVTARSTAANLVNEFLDKKNIFAVVGVSSDASKYGHKVFMDLLKAGYQVYAVHPAGGEINGHQRYGSLAELPLKPDVVSVVVPPSVALEIVKQCHKLGIHKVWLQPGSDSQAVLDYCQWHQIKVLAGLCIMIERQTFAD